MYAECERCRTALARAIKAVRQVFPGARIVATPGITTKTSAARSRREGEQP
jgi:hypothetical protein